MTDYHVHIGQWHDTYHEAETVFSTLKAGGVEELWFSSTTSCRYCTESIAVQKNAALQKELPTARELYELIRWEVQEALAAAESLGIRAHPLYWVVPEVHFSGAATVARAMAELPYEGFKLHPRGNRWNLTDAQTAALAEAVFSYADSHALTVLVHCDDENTPRLFEPFIARHPRATVQLAHSRPLEQTLYMLRAYPNTVCDSAFASEETVSAIRGADFADRIRYGSDYPISPIFQRKRRTPPPLILRAAKKNDIDAVRALIEAGADVNESGLHGITALMYAAEKNHAELAALLIAHGADVNAKNIMGWTALMKAANKNYVETVTLILANGADTTATDDDGKTALQIARERGSDAVAKLLAENGGRAYV